MFASVLQSATSGYDGVWSGHDDSGASRQGGNRDGGAGGIGQATGAVLAAEGASVVIADVDEERGREVAEQIGETAAFKQTDVSDAEQVQALVDFTVDRFGGLDIMFNNAGIGSPLKRFLPDDLEDFTRIMNVDLFGVLIGAQRAGRYMKDHGGGCIINNASIAAINAGRA